MPVLYLLSYHTLPCVPPGKHDLIGECTTTVSQLRQGPCEANTQSLVNPKKVGKKKYVNSGVLKLMSMGTREELSFLHHLRQGSQVRRTRRNSACIRDQ